MGISFVISSFVAGLLTFLAPCTLPLVPAYLGFISGVDQKDLQNQNHDIARAARRKIFLNGIFFILGFSIVFIVFGTLAGLLGQTLVPYRIWLARIGGAFVILFGLFMLGIFKLALFQTEKHIPIPSWLELGKPSSSLIIGGAFAFGWTPCVGPILGSILFLASVSATAVTGALLLTVFSFGLAIPFIILAAGYAKASAYIANYTRYLGAVSIVGGIFLVLLGILLVTDQFGLTIQYGYQLLDFINYDRLLDYL
ncbi:MAG: cytochrome C biogenesis protein [Candidatus Ryanbacteria bacterium CG10_big_fil_rev_8_21_14_0_10_43_42]|uniref:Cytochrome C biogenesis protein n=1 Tax=Candidatus Ryanbacteria bacterium CG10_big_fil_rev_8_21_14_0_10_43_42 TaxID=1974864 RepID=A0A2M8KVY0_9BACT|nr:MAG: cytochrome C biogenesis protein [Candidatus Ryanbacteria bacterium CG10_big_fil_rev_8_21_14_0_10_43_42]